MGAQLAPLVERELELETVERLLAGAGAGSGGAVVFEGPAGIGKSSLLAAARTAAAAKVRVLWARGGELERELPFGIVRQLLEPVVMACDPGQRAVLLAGAAALAKPVLFAADPEAGVEPSFSALHGLYWLTVNLADAQPLLVAVDDAHWADVASLRWLIYLARRLAGMPLALVLAARPAFSRSGAIPRRWSSPKSSRSKNGLPPVARWQAVTKPGSGSAANSCAASKAVACSLSPPG